jgi:hypothetical protein
VIAVSTFQDSGFPRPKKKERSGTGSKTQGGTAGEQLPARAIQNPDSAPRRGFWNLDRFQDPDIALQNPTYAPRPAIWKLKDKIQIPNSETAVSVYAPVL